MCEICFFSNLIDEYTTARRAVIVRMFIDALTKGGPNGVPKPIETYAHDKKRYVGDMLAWLRQYVPTEKENLQLFLKDCDVMKSGKLTEIAFISHTIIELGQINFIPI